MADQPPSFLQSLRSRRAMRRWAHAARSGGDLSHRDLARLAPVAREVASHASSFLRAADRKLLGPTIGDTQIDRPSQCDWAWRAGPWAEAMCPATIAGVTGGTVLTDGVRLFHDCPLAEITLRQMPASSGAAPAPYVLSMDALGFEGSFLSLAMDLPEEGATTLSRSHILVLTAKMQMEREAEVFARLNIRQGPNTEQLVSELRPGDRPDGTVTAEFDLGFHDIKPAKLETAWIDLIFDKPAMNLVRIDDFTVTRRPRADI